MTPLFIRQRYTDMKCKYYTMCLQPNYCLDIAWQQKAATKPKILLRHSEK
jgi:hypothetical protein